MNFHLLFAFLAGTGSVVGSKIGSAILVVLTFSLSETVTKDELQYLQIIGLRSPLLTS